MIRKISVLFLMGWMTFSVQANAIEQPNDSTIPLNGVTQAAIAAGVFTCTTRINQIATFLTTKATSGAYIFLPSKEQPDKSIFSTSMEIASTNAPAMYASASFYPKGYNECESVYDTVEYINNSCANVEQGFFKGRVRAGVLKKDIVIIAADQARFFLMPAGLGCVVIKKEISI